MTDHRTRAVELAKRLRDAARMQDPTAQAAVDLVKLHMDTLKDSLVDADGDGMLRAQGAARYLGKLYRELTTTPPTTMQPTTNRE